MKIYNGYKRLPRNYTLMTDEYEFTMANGYYQNGMQNQIAAFDVFFRKVPNNGGYAIMAGLDKVIDKLSSLTETIEREELFADSVQESHVLYKFKEEKPFTIVKDNDTYTIKGDIVEKLFRMTNFNTEEAYERFSNKLRRMGVDEELESLGIKEGDTVRILDFEFEWTR